jgi:hypothetical protein
MNFLRACKQRVHTEDRKAEGLRIRISSAELFDELLASLRAEPGAVVEQISDDEAEVTLLGSYQEDALRMALYLRLRAWEAAHRARGVHVEIVG